MYKFGELKKFSILFKIFISFVFLSLAFLIFFSCLYFANIMDGLYGIFTFVLFILMIIYAFIWTLKYFIDVNEKYHPFSDCIFVVTNFVVSVILIVFICLGRSKSRQYIPFDFDIVLILWSLINFINIFIFVIFDKEMKKFNNNSAISIYKLYLTEKKKAKNQLDTIENKEKSRQPNLNKEKSSIINFKPYYIFKNNPVNIFYFIAELLVVFSIFCFFGKIVKVLGQESNILSMFESALGINTDNRCKGLTFLFVWQIIIMIIPSFYNFFIYKDKRVIKYILLSINISLSIVAAIVSLCTLKMLGIESSDQKIFQLGSGPISFAIMHFIVIGFYFIGLSIEIYKKTQNLNPINKKTRVKNIKLDDESKIVDLLNKYKELFDNGIITKEEFEEKRKNLLNDLK